MRPTLKMTRLTERERECENRERITKRFQVRMAQT